MLSYNFYNKLIRKIERDIHTDSKKALKNYIFLKKYVFYDLLNFIDFIETLENQNKFSSEIRDILISLLIFFMFDENILFQDVKIIKKDRTRHTEVSKVKKIVDILGLDREKELIFWEGISALMTDLENYLEFYGMKEMKTRSLNEIKNDLRKIARGEKVDNEHSELFHYYS